MIDDDDHNENPLWRVLSLQTRLSRAQIITIDANSEVFFLKIFFVHDKHNVRVLDILRAYLHTYWLPSSPEKANLPTQMIITSAFHRNYVCTNYQAAVSPIITINNTSINQHKLQDTPPWKDRNEGLTRRLLVLYMYILKPQEKAKRGGTFMYCTCT